MHLSSIYQSRDIAPCDHFLRRIQSVKDQVEKVSESLGERRRMQEFVTVQLQSKIGGA